MANRRETPDLMAEVMGSNNKTSKEVNLETRKPGNLEVIKQVNKEARKQADTKPVIESTTKEKKVTFSFSISTLEKLEDSWVNLKRQVKGNGRITKNLIAERAIILAIRELEEKGTSSALFMDISNQKAK